MYSSIILYMHKRIATCSFFFRIGFNNGIIMIFAIVGPGVDIFSSRWIVILSAYVSVRVCVQKKRTIKSRLFWTIKRYIKTFQPKKLSASFPGQYKQPLPFDKTMMSHSVQQIQFGRVLFAFPSSHNVLEWMKWHIISSARSFFKPCTVRFLR